MSKISVIMPAHNAEHTIRASIESVRAQTYPEWELIVIDDGSTDGTAAIVEEYTQTDNRIRLVRNPACTGVGAARNRGGKEARHDYVAFLDSDDLWTPDRLERQMERVASCPDAKLFFSSTEYIDEKGQPYGYILRAPARVTARELLKQNVISCSSVLVEKEALTRHPMPEDPRIHEDLACWYGILSDTPYAAGIDLPLLRYRIRRDSKSGRKTKAARMQWRTYRYLKLSLWLSIRSFISYTLRNLKKYRSIHSS